MAKLSKEKGKRGEREVAALLRSFGFQARRGQQFSGSDDSPDVVHSIPGLHIEVKRSETFAPYAAMKQAIRDVGEAPDIPVVFHRRNNQEWLTVLRSDDFLRMMQWIVYKHLQETQNAEA